MQIFRKCIELARQHGWAEKQSAFTFGSNCLGSKWLISQPTFAPSSLPPLSGRQTRFTSNTIYNIWLKLYGTCRSYQQNNQPEAKLHLGHTSTHYRHIQHYSPRDDTVNSNLLYMVTQYNPFTQTAFCLQSHNMRGNAQYCQFANGFALLPQSMGRNLTISFRIVWDLMF